MKMLHKVEKRGKSKGGVAMVLTLALILTTAVPTYGASDISGHWAENIIKEASALGFVSGYVDGSYKPEDYIKREEFYTFLSKIMTVKPDTTNTQISFPDVVKGEWYEPVIKTAVAAGIASGYEDGTFGIGQLMSRQEAAKVVASVIPTKDLIAGVAGTESVKDQDQIAPWALPYVEIMFKKKYMKGDDTNMLHPTSALKRCEAITILLNIKKNEKVIAANADKLTEGQQIVSEGLGCRAIHGTDPAMFLAGEGTKRLPYEVKTEDQLSHVREHLSEEKFFVLKNNINVTKDFATLKPNAGSGESDWSVGNFVPVGTAKEPFKGHLDGGEFSVIGLNIKGVSGEKSSGETKPEASYAGLIGVLDKAGSISNLTVDDSTVSGNQYVGGVAGYSYGDIENCTLGVKGSVKGSSYTGGIVGYSAESLKANFNKGTIVGLGQYTGGIVGYIHSSGELLSDAVNYGSVTGTDKLGGIAGSANNSGNTQGTVRDCKNEGAVYTGTYNAGGILGSVDTGAGTMLVQNCVNSGTLEGPGVNGGIVGIITNKNVTVDSCKNSGTVEGSGAGGIVGNNQGFITDCYNTGKIKAKLDGGGIVAFQQNTGKITQCYNEGSVTSDSYAGGIAGENDNYLDNSYNNGAVSSLSYAGGIAGRNTATLANVYNAGTVSGDVSRGTLAGRNGGSILTSYWLDTSGNACVGMADRSNGYDPLKVKQLTHKQLSGQEKIVVSNKYVLLADLMNKNNLTQSDVINNIKVTELWKYTYRFTPSNSGGSSGGANELPDFDIIDDKYKPGNIIDSADLNDGTYLYPQFEN